MESCTVMGRFAASVSIGPWPDSIAGVGFATCICIDGGSQAPTESVTNIRPSSISESATTPVTGLVMEAMENIASACIGAPDTGSRAPIASRCTSLPSRAMATTQPGSLPAAISRSIAGRIRASLAADMPTNSGCTTGSGGTSVSITGVMARFLRQKDCSAVPRQSWKPGHGRRGIECDHPAELSFVRMACSKAAVSP
jgi:hypothetical protein